MVEEVSYGSSNLPGTVTIESIEVADSPGTWRLRGQITVDEAPAQLMGSFEIAGCVKSD